MQNHVMTHLGGLGVVVRVRDERGTEPTAPGALGLGKARQGDCGQAPALLLLHLSDLDHPPGDGFRVRIVIISSS